MWKYLAVLLVLASPALAENAKDRGSPSPGGHQAGAKHEPAKKQEAAKLDGIYSQEVAEYNDFISSGGLVSHFSQAQQAEFDYEKAVFDARQAKTINKSYNQQPALADPGQTAPDDLDNDGYADGMPGDPNGPD